jgi:hypothetical protein
MSNRPVLTARALGAVALLGAAGVVAALHLLPPAEAGRSAGPPGMTACKTAPAIAPARRGSFFKLEAKLDGKGILAGQRLYVGAHGQTTAWMDLPSESTVTGPVGGVVAIVSDDGVHSTVSLGGASDGCSTPVHTTASIVRRAVINPLDGSVLLHLLARAGRADLGVWRLATAGSQPVQVVEALPASLGVSPVWATDLRLDPTGRMLAVQSCLERTCLTRIVDLAAPTRPAIVIRGQRQGPMLGFAGDRLVTWAACDGFPCGILAWNLAASEPEQLVADATAAGMTGDGRLLIAILDGSAGQAVVVDLQTGRVKPLHGLAAGDRPIATGGLAAAGLEVDPDQLAVGQRSGDPHAIRPSAAGEVLP